MTGVTISPGPPRAQSMAHQTFRRLLGRSTAREGVLLLEGRSEGWAMIRTTRVTGGIKVEVIQDDTGQVVWRKFVPWKNLNRLPEVFAHASRKQERYGKKQVGES